MKTDVTNAAELKLMTDYIREISGIHLDESKGYLIESRLAPVMKDFGCETLSDLHERARCQTDAKAQRKIVEAISTNETLFFRDDTPFRALEYKVLPEMIDRRMMGGGSNVRLRIWSAACSSGQEAYSAAMMLRELVPMIDDWDVMIMATDISDEMVAKASYGAYADHEIRRGLPAAMLHKYFHKEGDLWRVNDELRAMVKFAKRNLLDPFSGLGGFDVVLCRNVAIYFEPEVQKRLFERIADVLAEDGVLFVGASENLLKYGSLFRPQHHCGGVFYCLDTYHTVAGASAVLKRSA